MIRFGTSVRRQSTPATRTIEELHTIVVASHTFQAILERSSDTCLQYVQVQAYATNSVSQESQMMQCRIRDLNSDPLHRRTYT